MDSISQLFDKFAVAYQHSLYAIEQEEIKAIRRVLEQISSKSSNDDDVDAW